MTGGAGADPSRSALRDRLADGARGELGSAAQVAREIQDCQPLLASAIVLLSDGDTVVVAHAAHSLMQVSLDQPKLFDPHVPELLESLERMRQWEIGEQLPKILVRCTLDPRQAERLAAVLEANLENRSNIAAASALSGLAELAKQGLLGTERFLRAIETARNSPRKALAARARRIEAGGLPD